MNNVSYTFTQTGAEPVALTDAKNFLRIDQTSDDSLVGALITSARSTAEKYINKLIVQQTVTMTMDSLPCGIGFKLPYGPVQSVTSITLTDNTGTTTTWNPSNYIVDLSGQRIVYATAATFPSSYNVANAVVVTYVAGYGLLTDMSGVPSGIVQAIRHLISASYENRETAEAVPPLVCTLLSPFKKYAI
jgi:uncharacterized phiE125 gp8 family phage protein